MLMKMKCSTERWNECFKNKNDQHSCYYELHIKTDCQDCNQAPYNIIKHSHDGKTLHMTYIDFNIG